MSPDGITAIFTTIIAIFTIVYSVFAYKLFRESKLSREFHLESHMIAYLVNGDSSPDIVSLVIRNIGNGIAKNLQFRIIKDLDYDACTKLKQIGIFKKKVDFFPPNYENKYILMSLQEEFNEKTDDYIEFELTYDDAITKDIKKIFRLEFSDIEGFGKITPPETYIGMIPYQLEKIVKILDRK